MLGNRAVLPVAGSRLVDITYSDPNPARAQRIAGGFADAFIASNLDKRFQANSYAKVFLEDQLAQLKLRLETIRKSAVGFRAEGTNRSDQLTRNRSPKPIWRPPMRR